MTRLHVDMREHDAPLCDETKSTYRKLLRSYSDNDVSDPVANRRPWHCKIAVEELVRFALRDFAKAELDERPAELCLLTSTCPDFIYGSENLLLDVKKFLLDGGRFRVLIYNDRFDVSGCNLFQQAAGWNGMEFRCSHSSYHGNKLKHFLTVNRAAYRVEAPHGTFKASDFTDFTPEVSARICFNDEQGAGTLNTFFDQLWTNCAPIVPGRLQTTG